MGTSWQYSPAILPILNSRSKFESSSAEEDLMCGLADTMEAKKDKKDTKEDFMLLHLRPPCAGCRRYLADEPFWKW